MDFNTQRKDGIYNQSSLIESPLADHAPQTFPTTQQQEEQKTFKSLQLKQSQKISEGNTPDRPSEELTRQIFSGVPQDAIDLQGDPEQYTIEYTEKKPSPMIRQKKAQLVQEQEMARPYKKNPANYARTIEQPERSNQNSLIDDQDDENSMMDLIIRKKQLEMELIELDIKKRETNMRRKSASRSRSPMQNQFQQKSTFQKKAEMFTDSNDGTSFEYFRQDDLSSNSSGQRQIRPKTTLSQNKSSLPPLSNQKKRPTSTIQNDQHYQTRIHNQQNESRNHNRSRSRDQITSGQFDSQIMTRHEVNNIQNQFQSIRNSQNNKQMFKRNGSQDLFMESDHEESNQNNQIGSPFGMQKSMKHGSLVHQDQQQLQVPSDNLSNSGRLQTQGPPIIDNAFSTLMNQKSNQPKIQRDTIQSINETIEPTSVIGAEAKKKKKKDNKKDQKDMMSRTNETTTEKPKDKKNKSGSGRGGDGPGSFPLPMEMLGNFEDGEDDINFFEPISYKKLERVISTRHPVDPETKKRFSLKDRITVIEYEAKVSDACFCYAATQFMKELTKKIKKKVKGPKQNIFARPPSMMDMPESNSSTESGEDDGATKGLTQCSISLGEGATLYLQMMKTISLMFLILTIMNLPLFFMYELNTTGNQLGNFNQVFKYYTLGNLGQMDKKCQHSDLEYYFNETIEEKPKDITVDCVDGYIGELKSFGFLYKFDKLYGGDTIAEERCKFIMNPMMRYKKPKPKAFCEEDQDPNIIDCVPPCDETLNADDPTQPQNCKFRPKNVTDTTDKVVEEDIKGPDEANTTEDMEQKMTEFNVDPLCEFVNKTKHTKKNFWVNDEADKAFRSWFEINCYFNKSCTFNTTQFGEYYNETALKPSSTYMDARESITSRYTADQASEAADDILNDNLEDDTAISKINQTLGFFDLISDSCKARMNDLKVTSYEFIGVVGCKYDDVKVPLTRQTRLHKEWIGIIIIVCDVLSICIIYYFFSKIRVLNEEVLRAMDDLKVQMKDFGVKIDDLKLDRFTQDSRLIKFKIWLYFTKIFQNHEIMHEFEEEDETNQEEKEELKLDIAHENKELNKIMERSEAEETDNPSDSHHNAHQGYNFKIHPTHQILDVCLSIYTQPSIQCVFRMQEIQLEINFINNKLHTGGYQEEEIPDKQDELKALTEKQKRFEARYRDLTRKKKLKAGQSMTVERVPRSQRLREIQYVFVIFKNCETNEIVQQICPSESTLLNKKKPETVLFGKQPKIVPILEPDEIIWENLAYSGEQQRVRRYIMQTVSSLFLVGNTLFTMYLAGFKYYLNAKIPNLNCDPELTYGKEESYIDHMKLYNGDENDNPTGLLACYCSRETTPFIPWTLVLHNFSEFSKYIPESIGLNQDNWNHCAQWWGLQVLKELLLFFISTSAVFINEIVADFFQELGQFQKKHTKLEEQITCFRQIFSQEYINMGIIVLITSFDQIGLKAAILGDLAGKSNVYTGFDPNWYMDYGNKICIFIFMSSFVVNSKDIVKFILTVLKRFRDRSFKMNLKLDPEDEGCDKPNTRIRIQADLEALYTGKEFKGEKAYSRMMSTLFVILMYSSGMPILYFIGCIFYFVTYWVNKFLLINYYKKSTTLTRTIPLFAMDFMKYSLFMHSFISLLMLTNPIAFKTKNREYVDEVTKEKVLLGVDPMLDAKVFFNWFIKLVLNSGTNESNEEQDQEVMSIDHNQVVKFLFLRLQFFHQQLFFAFLFTYIMIMFLGKTIYGIIYVVFMMIYKSIMFVIKTVTNFMKKKARQAKSAIKVKVLQRKQSISEKQRQLGEQENKIKPEISNSFSTDKSMKEAIEDQAPPDNVIIHKAEDKDESSNNSRRQSFLEAKRIEAENLKKLKLKEQQKKQNRPDYSDNILLELSCENLSNFYQRCKKERQDFWEIFQWDRQIGDELLTDNFGGDGKYDDYRTLFLETLYTYRITQDDVIFYQMFLNDRLEEIEQIVDRYFGMFKIVLLTKMKEGYARDRARLKKLGKEGSLKDQVERRKHEEWALKSSDDVQFEDPEHFPYERKLKILVEYQEELIQADKDRKENRRGIQEICRMTGSLAQSYFIFDSFKYKVGRKIYYAVDDEEEEDNEDQDDINEILGQNNDSSSSNSQSSESSDSDEKDKSKGDAKSQKSNRRSKNMLNVVAPE